MNRGIFFCILVLTLTSFSLALSGVGPSSYTVDFEPNLKQEFTFSYIFDAGVKVNYYLSGALAKYAKIKKVEEVNGRQQVTVKLSLPDKLDNPGINALRVGAKEEYSKRNGISIASDVGAHIKVRVPYPAKYVEMSLETEYVNVGENVPYKLTVYSRGEDDIFVKPKLRITDENGSLIREIRLENKEIKSAKNYVYDNQLKTYDLTAGDYNLTAIVEYGTDKPAQIIKLFRIGELRVELINYTKKIKANQVNRLNFKVESFWNNQINNVYINGEVINYLDKDFITPTINIKPWQIANLEAFLDTNNIKEDKIDINLTVFYADTKSYSEMIELIIVKGINWVVIGFVAGGLIVLLLIVSLAFTVWMLIKKRKNKNENQKKSKK